MCEITIVYHHFKVGVPSFAEHLCWRTWSRDIDDFRLPWSYVTESFDVSRIRLEQREQVVEAYGALAKVVENDNFLVSVASEVFVEITDESYLLIHRYLWMLVECGVRLSCSCWPPEPIDLEFVSLSPCRISLRLLPRHYALQA